MVTDDPYYRVLQMRLAVAQLRLGLTQEEAADLADLLVWSCQGLDIRDSRNFNPTLQTLRGVAAALQLYLPDLIAEASNEEIQSATQGNRTARRVSKRQKAIKVRSEKTVKFTLPSLSSREDLL